MMSNALAPLLNHLWQSTVFGLAAAGAALALRRYRPAVRYWLWVAASLKFLFPLALLVEVGGRFRLNGVALPPGALNLSQTIIAPASTTAPFLTYAASTPAAVHASPWPLALAGIWLAGFAAIALGWVREWRAVRALVRAAKPLDWGLPIPTVSSASKLELGVFGVFRPVLIVPARLRECVSAEQLSAILAHEMAHVRRRDNLWAALHQLAKALFWVHPLVWWAESRMAIERELACDEYAVSSGARPSEYAESILRVCRFYAQAPACMAGISGADLKQRVVTIADNAFGRGMGPRMKTLLVGLTALCLLLPFAAGALNQDQTAVASYGTASVKPTAPGGRGSGIRNGPEGGLRCINDTVDFLIAWAYDIQDFQIAGAPKWASSIRYDVTFTAATTASQADNSPGQVDAAQMARTNQQRLRLQQVLHDRFGLVLHQETRIMPVYTLEVARPLLKIAAKDDPTSFGRSGGDPPGQWTGSATPMAFLTRFLANQLQRPVVDGTGLTGLYDFKLTFDPASVRPQTAPETSASGEGLPSLFGALKDQLGLKLETKKRPVEFLVIDKIAPPAAN